MDRTKKHRRMRRKRALVFAILSAVLALILLGLIALGIFVSLHIPDIKALFADSYVIRYYTAENPNSAQKRQSYDADFICRQGSVYLDFSTLSELCGFSVSGDAEQRRYILGEGYADTLTVDLGTTSVILSGQPATLRTPSFLAENGSLYLPCEFIDRYFTGITVETEEDNDHSIRVTFDTQEGFGLTLRKSEECQEVEPPGSMPDGGGNAGDTGDTGNLEDS